VPHPLATDAGQTAGPARRKPTECNYIFGIARKKEKPDLDDPAFSFCLISKMGRRR
jgi:hypothetical protein